MPLSESEYEDAQVPSSEDIRRALSKGAEVLRKAAGQQGKTRVDPGIRFR